MFNSQVYTEAKCMAHTVGVIESIPPFASRQQHDQTYRLIITCNETFQESFRFTELIAS